MYTTISTYYFFLHYCLLSWFDWYWNARKMYRLTKYTKNKLRIKLIFLYTIISRCAVNRTKKSRGLCCKNPGVRGNSSGNMYWRHNNNNNNNNNIGHCTHTSESANVEIQWS
jgi:hypothetical protein